MPITLRLPEDLEAQIAGFGARAGLSKSAVILRSIREFLAKHTEASSLQIYAHAMRESAFTKEGTVSEKKRQLAEQRGHKLMARAEMRRKHETRSANEKFVHVLDD